ncbi:hypothetical protein THAR02_08441 [Trichoderma harzianum]|uniref:Uncharacterized protein n=1 Tax=Trichoderma harzianum TaxID=5544 RepID=A0A0F9XFS1_TRIHA|nr:hypothetical protein THAR02_08441 [Trichoderma harzianum]
MVRFDTPYPGNEKTKHSQWYKAAPRLQSKQDFEREFEESNKRRLEELQSLLNDMYWDISKNFPSRATRMAPSDVCTLNCLEHFVRLLGGYVLDRKADIEAAQTVERQNYTEGNPLQEGGGIFVEDESETLIREIPRSPSAEPEYEEYSFEDEEGSQLPYDVDWGYRLGQKNDTLIATGHGSWKPASYENTHDSGDDGSQDFEDVNETNCEFLKPASDDDTHNSDDDSQDFVDANESVATEDGLRRQSSVLSKSSSSISAKKRVQFGDEDEDEDEDEDVGIHEPKRRKLENPLSPTPTSPTAHVPSSIKQLSDARLLRKRLRPDEEEEEEEDNGYKRQEIENVPRPPSPISPASSTEHESASHPGQGTLEKVPKERASINGRCKQRKQKSTLQISRAKSPQNTLTTRSSRRATSSTLWELDSSGKSRSI